MYFPRWPECEDGPFFFHLDLHPCKLLETPVATLADLLPPPERKTHHRQSISWCKSAPIETLTTATQGQIITGPPALKLSSFPNCENIGVPHVEPRRFQRYVNDNVLLSKAMYRYERQRARHKAKRQKVKGKWQMANGK